MTTIKGARRTKPYPATTSVQAKRGEARIAQDRAMLSQKPGTATATGGGATASSLSPLWPCPGEPARKQAVPLYPRPMAPTLTKTERRVLSAFALLLEAEAPATVFGFKSIRSTVDIVSLGRKSSELQIHDALQKLVAAGRVEKTVTTGMGGGFTDYRLLS